MKKMFMLDGGAGRILAALPALLKYDKLHPSEDWGVVVAGWDYLFWGTPLQDRTYSTDTKGVFDNIIKDCEKIVTPEPYRLPAYFNQKCSLVEAFDKEINNTDDHSDLGSPMMVLSKAESMIARNTIEDLKNIQKKQKTVVFQPFGRGAKKDRHDIVDEESRSLGFKDYLFLAKKLSQRYNLIFFGEPDFQMKEDTYASKYTCDLRQWASIIGNSDYFLGVDSVGQHMARALGIPGTVLFGSTFPINTSYPDYFQIIEHGSIKKYSPIRIAGLDAQLANRLNENTMKYTDKELNDMFNKIVEHIEKSTK